MKIEVKTVNISKSKISQMTYVGIPTDPNTEIIGWVVMADNRRWVIKIGNNYHRADFIVQVHKEFKRSANVSRTMLTHVSYICANSGGRDYSNTKRYITPNADEAKNIALYEWLLAFQKKTIQAGQIYY